MIFSFLPIVLVLLAGSPAAASAGAPADGLRAALEGYTAGVSGKDSATAAADAFFLFEDSSLDRDLKTRDRALYKEIEEEWARLIGDMKDRAPANAVRARGEKVLALLDRAAESSAAPRSVFFDALLIILREGFEAILVVSALAAYLGRIGRKDKSAWLYGGAAAAVVASFGLWLAARTVIRVSGVDREALEGATMLLAAVVLFWVSYWLVSKAEARRWQAFVRSRIDRALSRGTLAGFAFLSFIVVFREGFETVLFYEALAGRAGASGGATLVAAGFGVGCAALAVFYALFLRLGPRIPLHLFFGATGGLLYFMAFKFAGAGVRELQVAQMIEQTPLSWMPDAAWLRDWLGVYPYLETSALQLVLVVLALFAAALTLRGRRTATEPAEPVPVRRVARG